MPSWWTCPCGTRNERRKQRCTNVECRRKRPAKRGPRHARILSGDTYPLFVQAARDIHGVNDEACCVCGKPRSQERRHDRDHDHRTGEPRGLACGGDKGCNVLMPSWLTAQRAVAIAAYLSRVEAFYAVRGVPVASEEVA